MCGICGYVSKKSINIEECSDEIWTISSPIEQQIRKKIIKNGIPLKKWDININRGITTGFNDAFILTEIQKNRLVEMDRKSLDIIKPLIRGKDIKRYLKDNPYS